MLKIKLKNLLARLLVPALFLFPHMKRGFECRRKLRRDVVLLVVFKPHQVHRVITQRRERLAERIRRIKQIRCRLAVVNNVGDKRVLNAKPDRFLKPALSVLRVLRSRADCFVKCHDERVVALIQNPLVASSGKQIQNLRQFPRIGVRFFRCRINALHVRIRRFRKLCPRQSARVRRHAQKHRLFYAFGNLNAAFPRKLRNVFPVLSFRHTAKLVNLFEQTGTPLAGNGAKPAVYLSVNRRTTVGVPVVAKPFRLKVHQHTLHLLFGALTATVAFLFVLLGFV